MIEERHARIWPPQFLRSTSGIQDLSFESAFTSTSKGYQSSSCRLLWSQYHPQTQLVGFSSHAVSVKTQNNFSLHDKDQTPESLMQSAQTRLVETISDCKPSSHTPSDQQNLMVTLCKSLHQEYHWERHSWCPVNEVPVVCRWKWHKYPHMSFLRPGRRYLCNQAHHLWESFGN